MRARRARRDAERGADLLVRSPRGDEAHDLELAAREAGDALRRGARRRTRAELAQLLARRVELAFRAEMREHFVRAPQLAHRALAIARLGEHARQLTAHARRVGHVRNRLQRVSGARSNETARSGFPCSICDERVARVGPRETQPLSERRRLAPQSFGQRRRALEYRSPTATPRR